jgi:hypothetical protein
MAFSVTAALRERILAHLIDNEPNEAYALLTGEAGGDDAEAKAWLGALESSTDPLEAATLRCYRGHFNAARDEQQRRAAEEEDRLVRGLKYDFPPGALDLAYQLLYTPVGVPEMALSRAAHLCRLANSFALMHRQGELDQAGAQRLLRGGSPGYSDAVYEHAWANGMEVSGRSGT